MGEVCTLQLVEVGANFRFEADELLEQAKGQDLTNLVIISEHADGSVSVAGMANAGEALILMERAKNQIVGGRDD